MGTELRWKEGLRSVCGFLFPLQSKGRLDLFRMPGSENTNDQLARLTGFFCLGFTLFSGAICKPLELCSSIQSSSKDRLKRQRLPSLNAGIRLSEAYLYRLSELIPR